MRHYHQGYICNTVQQIVDGTMKNTGKCMCAACYKEWRKNNADGKAAG